MNAKISHAAKILFIGLAFLSLIILIKPAKAQSDPSIVNPTADAYVDQSKPTTNYGSRNQLRVDGSPYVYSYLRFVVAGLNGATIRSATLQIYANSSSSTGVVAFLEPDHTWTENGITYSNAPGFGVQLGQSVRFSGHTWISIDVSSVVTGEGEVDFALGGLNSTAISLASREDPSHAPQLVLITQSEATATPNSPTSTASSTSTASATASATAIITPSMTPSPKATDTASATATITPSTTPSPSASATATVRPSMTPSQTASATASSTPSLVPTATATQTPFPTASPSPRSTATLVPSATSTPTFMITATPIPTAQSILFISRADTYVNQSSPTNNYGNSSQIRVDGSPLVYSYLRFVVAGLNGAPVSSATLQIYANSSSSAGVAAYLEPDQSWTENGITYNNAPGFGAQVGQSGQFSGGVWISIDVSSAVSGEGEVDLVLGGLNSTAISLASREDSTHAPQLVVMTQGGATPTALPTAPNPSPTPTPSTTPTPFQGNTPTLTMTVIATSTATQAATPTPQPSTTPGDPVILAAGDIAKCGGGTPAPGSGAFITSNMLLGDIGNIFTLGDNSNDSGSLADYQNCFQPTWGRLMDRLDIAMGNHDIGNAGQDFFTYFSGMTGDWGHYSLNLGSWHIIVLNAECSIGGQGCGASSVQETWLRQDLASNSQSCVLAIWHQPLFTSGTQSPYTGVKTFWQDLYAYGADVILNGHNHNYERFDPQNPDAVADPNGIREFVVGTGGASLDTSHLPLADNEVVRSAEAYGYLRLTLHANSYDWQFVAQPGSGFSDSGSAACH
jgi:hypothetical protein